MKKAELQAQQAVGENLDEQEDRAKLFNAFHKNYITIFFPKRHGDHATAG